MRSRDREFRAAAERLAGINFHSRPAHRRSRRLKVLARRAARRAARQSVRAE